MGYYRAGDVFHPAAPAIPDLGYSDPEVPIPDPLADDLTRTSNLAKAWRRMRAAQEKKDMGYYRAGDDTGWHAPMLIPPSAGSTDITAGDSKQYVTPAMQRWYASGHPVGTYPSASRRMNVGNVRALRRSMRRVQGFAHLAKKVMTFTAHHKMKKRRKR